MIQYIRRLFRRWFYLRSLRRTYPDVRADYLRVVADIQSRQLQ